MRLGSGGGRAATWCGVERESGRERDIEGEGREKGMGCVVGGRQRCGDDRR